MIKYSQEQKKQFVNKYVSGSKVKDICSENNISKSTFYNWIKKYKNVKFKNKRSCSARQLYLLEKKIKRLAEKVSIWRCCNCSTDSPLEQKLESIKRIYKRFSVHACCRVLEVERSTFYHYLLRSPEQTMIEKDDELFKPIIKRIFDESKGRIGAKKIRAIMITVGYVISPERISRLMKEMNLICVSSKKKIKYNFTPRTNYKNNILKRQFYTEDPNSAWVSDITVLYVNYKPYYLRVIIDLFSRKVISYSISNNQKTPMVLNTFKNAYENRNPIDLIFHSNQGSQYISWDGSAKSIAVDKKGNLIPR